MNRVLEAPPIVGANIPKRNADGIRRHAQARNVRGAKMVADVSWWKAKRRADRLPARAKSSREIVKAKSRKRATVIG
jgi:hypothetical protein